MIKEKNLFKTLKVCDLKSKKIKNFLEKLTDDEKQTLVDELKMFALGYKKEPRFLFENLDVEDLENYPEQEENFIIQMYENRILDLALQDADEYAEYMESEYDKKIDGLYEVIEGLTRFNVNAFSPLEESDFRAFSEEIDLDDEDIDNYKKIYLEFLKDRFEDHEYLDEILTLGTIYINSLYSEDDQELDNFYAEFNRF